LSQLLEIFFKKLFDLFEIFCLQNNFFRVENNNCRKFFYF